VSASHVPERTNCDVHPCDGRTLQRRLDHARALLAASAVLEHPSATLGAIVLRPDQIETTRRVRAHLARDGGCLLADDVGTGKTYVALDVAKSWAHPLVVVPASLRTTWAQAARRADVRCAFVSHETLSRGRAPPGRHDLIVVDESHRFRPTSRRHAALATLAAQAPVLMLSATPMQNRARELAAQLALFLGELAYTLAPEQLARWVVRSAGTSELPLPRVRPARWLPVDADDGEVLRAILALPPPPRAADAGDGGVLVQLSLVRAWASSRGALVAAVRRRQRTLAALDQCHQEGRLPTRRELRSWDGGGDVQLGFPMLLASSVVDGARRAALTDAIARERDTLLVLLQTITDTRDPDSHRVETLRSLRRAHAEESILAFSESRSTVHSYWLALRRDSAVGMLSAREARIASGRLRRDELLDRFAPRAQGVRAPAHHERVTLLLTTDLLSEGVNLQDASVVVHLDLPWNPARLAQRLGRIRRPGGSSEVASYLMSPPARAALLLRAELRLRAKLARAELTIGRSVDVLPLLAATNLDSVTDALQVGPDASGWSAAELRGEIARRLASWRSAADDDGLSPEGEQGFVAATRADVSGWLALLDDGRLIAMHRDGDVGPSDAPASILRALEHAAGPARAAHASETETAQRELDEWIARDWLHLSTGIEAVDTPVRRRVRRALEHTLNAAPRHRRAKLIATASTIRHALTRPLPLGVERALDALVDERTSRAEWMEDASAVIARAPTVSGGQASDAPARSLVVILFG
jgi:superfamily II DNA or RNA helicase